MDFFVAYRSTSIFIITVRCLLPDTAVYEYIHYHSTLPVAVYLSIRLYSLSQYAACCHIFQLGNKIASSEISDRTVQKLGLIYC